MKKVRIASSTTNSAAKVPETIPVGDFYLRDGGSIDPRKFPNETFDLYSIPSYDVREPDLLAGAEIGSAKKIVCPGDVLLSRIIPHIQRVWVVGNSRGRRQIASGEWIVFRTRAADPRYLRYMLLSKAFHHEFLKTVSGVGGSLLRARPSEVAKIRIPLPKLEVQRRIVEMLDLADSVHCKHEQLVALAGNFMRSAFLDIFGDPVSNPKGLPTRPLSEVATFISGATPSKSRKEFWDGSFPWVSPKDMKQLVIDGAQDHVSDVAFAETNMKKIPLNTVLIVVRGMILAHTVPIAITASEVAINQDMKAIIFDKKIDPCFGLWCLKVQHGNLLSKIDTAAHGTKRFDMDRLGGVPIILPSDDDQRRFVKLGAQFSTYQTKLRVAAQLEEAFSASLAQRALHGEL